MQIKKFVNRFLSLLLCLAMVVSYLPGISIGAKADAVATDAVETETVHPEAVLEEALPEDVFPDVVEPQPEELLASGTTYDGLYWTLDNNGHLSITGSGAINEAPWKDYVDNIYTATIGDGITAIGEYAFNGCGYMKSIEIPDSVTSIGQMAFANCFWLLSFDIPEGVTVIEPYTFFDCEALGSIVIPEGVTTIKNSAFLECASLSEVYIPDSVTTIENFAFSHCDSLSALYVGNGVTSIGQEAFYSTSLKVIRFTGDAPTFGENAFMGAFCPGYYPADNATWTADAKVYPVNWLPLGDMIGINLVRGSTAAVVVGDELSADYIEAVEVYENDVTFPIFFENLTISGYDSSETGRHPFTVAYGDYTVEAVAAVHESRSMQVLDSALYPESNHSYQNDANEYKEFSVPGASSITLTFSEDTETEQNYDYVYIYDAHGNQIGCFDGDFGGTTVTVPGEKVIIRLYTDSSATRWGYSFSEIKADTVTHSGAAIEAKEPTCEEDGGTAGIYCDVCELSYGVTVLPALGHCYEGMISFPTQTTQGYTTYTCVNCGDTYISDYTTWDKVAYGVCGDNLTWVLNGEGVLTVSGTGDMYEYGNADTMSWKYMPYEIKTLVIEEGVTSIGDYAFEDIRTLTSVTIADSVETIGLSAFRYDYNLVDLDLGNGVKNIRDYAFDNCYNLKSLTIPDSVEYIYSCAFRYCTALESITLGSGVTYIGESAFHSSNISQIVLPESLQTIEVDAFAECDALQSIRIPAAVSYIAIGAFDDCESLMSFEVHPDNAYYSSDSCGVLFDKNQQTLMQYPQALAGEYSVPGTVTKIEAYAFENASNLTAVTIPGSVQTISYEAFYNCDKLTSVTLAEGLITIDDYAFGSCDELQSVVIPDSVTTVGARVFQYCSALHSVAFGSGLTNMGSYVFQSCNALETVEFTGDGLYISYGTFNDVEATVYYPANNPTWTSDILSGYYGGNITWVALGDVTGFEVLDDVVMLCVGESLNSQNLRAVVIREGDVRAPANFAELTISNYDNTVTGRQEVTVSWNGYSDTVILAIHNGQSDYLVDASLYPESAHQYDNNTDDTQVLTVPGAKSITLTFSAETETESNYDYIYIYDGADNQIAWYSGSGIGGQTVTVEGDTVKVRLTSDGSQTRYGYSFSSITADTMEHTGDATEGLEPTCTTGGYTAGVYCTICEDYVRTELPALGHTYEGTATEPTPDTQGYTTYTCVNCGDSYVGNYVSYDNVANGICGENLTWVLSYDGTLTISGTGNMYEYGTETMNWRDAGYTIKRVVIGDDVTSIGDHAFYGCVALENVVIGNGVTSIGRYAFQDCDALTAITIGGNVKTIKMDAFFDCNALTNVTLCEGVNTLEYGAFRYCNALPEMNIPDSVTSIGSSAFSCCYSMTSVTIGSGVTNLGESVFGECNSLTDITVDADNQNYSSDASGVLFDKNKTMLIKAPVHLSGHYAIPYGVVTIGQEAFRVCDNLTGVTIPESVTTIGNKAFVDCEQLKTVTIPDSVTSIEEHAFGNCDRLSSIYIGSGVTEIGNEAFAYNYNLTNITFAGDAPIAGNWMFDGVNATAYYPMNNPTWTEEVMNNIGSGLSWVGLGAVTGIQLKNDLILLCVGETLGENHIQAELIREGGVNSPVDFSSLMISQCDTSTTGRKNITVMYGGYSVEAVVAVHEGRTEQVVDSALYPESDHNYGHGLNEIKTITVPGSSYIALTFSAESCTESGCDYVTVLDGAGARVSEFTGNSMAGATVIVPGDTAQIRLDTDGSVSEYGYSFSEIKAELVTHTGENREGLAPTCTEPGYTDYVYCTICQADANKIVVPALGHTYDGVVTDPTPTTGGYTTYTCTVCGDSYVGNHTTYDNVANGTCGENITWVQSFDGTVTISGTGEMSNGYPRVDWTTSGYDVINVIVEEGVTSIVSYAFQNCEKLTQISLPTSLEKIGYSAFNNCYALKDIVIPYGVTEIDSYAFLNAGIETIELPETLQIIRNSVFHGCSYLQSITIPASVTVIEGEVFYNCTSLTDVNLPDSLTTIPYNMFTSCTALEKIQLPANLERIESQAFGDCENLKEIQLPASLTYLGDYAFRDCDNLRSITIPNGVEQINPGTFIRCFNLESISIPDTVTSIGEWSLADIRAMDTLSIPDSVTSIGENAFNCSDFKSIKVGSGVTEILGSSFASCDMLESVHFAGDMPFIAENAFNWDSFTAYYPAGNETWTEDKLLNYGGNINWVALGALSGIRVVDPVIFVGLNETVSFANVEAYAVHEGGAELRLDPSVLTFGTYDTSTTGKKTVTVSYGDFSAEITVAVHEGQTNVLVDPSLYPESEHDYRDYTDQTQSLVVAGATQITLTFSEQTLTEGCDYIYVMDANNLIIAQYSGDRAAGVTVSVPGDTVQIRLVTDGSITYYGYSFDSIYADKLIHSGPAADPKPATCTENGYNNAIICDVCDQLIRYDLIPMEGHRYEAVETAPTPEEDGYTTHTCVNCGDSFTDNYVNYYNVASGDTGEVSWKLAYDGTLTIYGEGYMANYEYYMLPPWLYPYVADKYPVKYVVIEEGVRNVGNYAFQNAYRLESVSVPASVTEIGIGAFENSQNLKSVTFAGDTMTIYDMAFRECHSLESIVIPDNCTYIGTNAFEFCYSLKSVVLPELLQWIGYRTFADCVALEAIDIPANVEAIDSYAFENCNSLQSVTIPASVTYIGGYAFNSCTNLNSLTVDSGNTAYWTDEYGVLFTKDQSQLIQAPGGLSGHYTVPETVEYIWEYAFMNCDKLTGVTIPNSVSFIEQGTFYSCDLLTDVTLPNSVTAIAYRAFAECVSLSDIRIPQNVSAIVDYAFSECYSLNDINFLGDAPAIDSNVFSYVAANAYYPASNPTWTADKFQNYGGNLCWITAGDIGILAQSAEGVGMDGETAMFVVEAVGNGLTYQWQYRKTSTGKWTNTNAKGSKEPVLYTAATFSRHGYEYRCEITDINGNVVYTNPAKLYVMGISAQPADVYAVDGEIPTFTVHVSGRELHYQWQYRSNAKAKWNDTNAVGAETATLTVDAESWRDGYQYRCIIVDTYFGMEFVSDVATLSVLSIETPPVNSFAAIDDTVQFKVEATGAKLTYQWQSRTSAKGTWKDSSATGNKTNALSISATAARGGYQYRCIIKDGAGNTVTTNPVTLYVWGINTQPASKTVKAGTTAKFTVSTVGDDLEYQWQYRTSSSGSWKNTSATGSTTKTMSIKGTTARHGYQYRCVIKNSNGKTITSKTVTLYVLGITSQPTSKTVEAGTTAKFTVSATGRSLTYQWQYRSSSSGSWKNTSATGCKTKTLSIAATTSKNGYQYRCKLTDASGNTVYSSTVTLRVLGFTSQPTSKTVVAGKTAKFTVSAVGSSVKYQWQYRTSSSGSWKNVSKNGTSSSYSVKTEARHSGYQYRCKITDSAGNTIYSQTASLYVLGIKTQPTSKSVKAGTTVKFTVSAVGRGLKYQWQYRTSSSGSWKNVSKNGTSSSYSLKTATRHKGYQYRCKITDSAGNVIYTNVAKLTVK